MPTATERRRSRFRRALAVDGGKSLSAWAREQGLSKAHVSQVLSGKRDSISLTARIDAYIDEKLTKRPSALAS